MDLHCLLDLYLRSSSWIVKWKGAETQRMHLAWNMILRRQANFS